MIQLVHTYKQDVIHVDFCVLMIMIFLKNKLNENPKIENIHSNLILRK